MKNSKRRWIVLGVVSLLGAACGGGKQQPRPDASTPTPGDGGCYAPARPDGGNSCTPATIREALDLAAIKALTLTELGWTLKETRTLPGLTVYVGDWSGGVFPGYDSQGNLFDLELREAAAVYVPTGYPGTGRADLGFVNASHYARNIDSPTAATIARHFGIPVLFHGEYPNWERVGYPTRDAISKATGPAMLRVNPCTPVDFVRGSFPLALAQANMRAITLLQRLAERAGGSVNKVALRGFSKEGGAAWLVVQADDRIEVAIPGGNHGEDDLASAAFNIAANGCEAGSPRAADIQAIADGMQWRTKTEAGIAITKITSVVMNVSQFYPRVFLIDGDVGMHNMHDGKYGMGTGDESSFLDGFTSRPWRYVRKATVLKGADGEDGDVVSTAAVPLLGAELLVADAGSEASFYPGINSATANLTGDSLVVTALTTAAATSARVWWTWSPDRVFNDTTQEPWKSEPLTATDAGVWTSAAITVPSSKVIAWYAEVANTVLIEGTSYERTHAAPMRILRPTPDKQCTPTPLTCK